MKNKTVIKEKKHFSLREKTNIFLTILFSIVSLGIGFLIAYFGKGSSYVETELITAIITLFGFGLTATVFVYQAFEKSQSNDTMDVIKALSRTLILTLCLVMASLVLNFFVSVITLEVLNLILESVMYATLVYSAICQFDILNSFIVIITQSRRKDGKNDE